MNGLFILLEPGFHMFKVMEAAHRRGLTVVVCHSQPVTPVAPFDAALPCISHFVAVDGWRDDQTAFETIVAWCGARPVKGIYAGFEITLRAESRLRTHFGLPGVALSKLDFLLDKAQVRGALRDAGLTQLRVVEDAQLRQLKEWPFPGRAGFLKPINGSGSTYVRRCTELSEVQAHVADWDGHARHIRPFVSDYLRRGRGLFLEEEAAGELLSMEGYSHQGRYVPIGITDRTVLARDIAIEMGNTFPCPHPRKDEIIAKVRAIHQCLGVSFGATHTEVIAPPIGGGEIELVELNLRFAGGDILILVDRAFGVSFEDDLVTLATGEGPLSELPDEPRCYAAGQDFLAPPGLKAFATIDIPGDDVFFKKVTAKVGPMKSTDFQTDHVAAFAVAAETYRGALERADQVRAAATINGERLGDNPNNVVINYGARWAPAR
jgi:biotin carboxylase